MNSVKKILKFILYLLILTSVIGLAFAHSISIQECIIADSAPNPFAATCMLPVLITTAIAFPLVLIATIGLMLLKKDVTTKFTQNKRNIVILIAEIVLMALFVYFVFF